MRTVLITDEVSPDVAEAVRFARSHGIEEIAIRAVSDQAILALDEAATDALVACVSELRVPVASLLSPLFKAYLPGRSGPPLVDPNIPQFSLDASLHLGERDRLPPLAARLGSDCVRVFSFLREPGAAGGLPAEARVLLSELAASAAGPLRGRERGLVLRRLRGGARALRPRDRRASDPRPRQRLVSAPRGRRPAHPRARSSSGSPTCT